MRGQRHLQVAKDIYQASYFVATMASEYVAEKGALDDGFEDFCQAKAKLYLLQMPVAPALQRRELRHLPGRPKKIGRRAQIFSSKG